MDLNSIKNTFQTKKKRPQKLVLCSRKSQYEFKVSYEFECGESLRMCWVWFRAWTSRLCALILSIRSASDSVVDFFCLFAVAIRQTGLCAELLYVQFSTFHKLIPRIWYSNIYSNIFSQTKHIYIYHGYTVHQQYWTLFITNWCTQR